MASGNWLAQADEPSESALGVLRDALEQPERPVREHVAGRWRGLVPYVASTGGLRCRRLGPLRAYPSLLIP